MNRELQEAIQRLPTPTGPRYMATPPPEPNLADQLPEFVDLDRARQAVHRAQEALRKVNGGRIGR